MKSAVVCQPLSILGMFTFVVSYIMSSRISFTFWIFGGRTQNRGVTFKGGGANYSWMKLWQTGKEAHLDCKQTLQFGCLAKWLRGRLRTKWLLVRIMLLSLKLQIWRLLWARSSLTFRQTIEGGLTLKLVRDMIIRYSQIALCYTWRKY